MELGLESVTELEVSKVHGIAKIKFYFQLLE